MSTYFWRAYHWLGLDYAHEPTDAPGPEYRDEPTSHGVLIALAACLAVALLIFALQVISPT